MYAKFEWRRGAQGCDGRSAVARGAVAKVHVLWVTQSHQILYEDGEHEWVRLSREAHTWWPGCPEASYPAGLPPGERLYLEHSKDRATSAISQQTNCLLLPQGFWILTKWCPKNRRPAEGSTHKAMLFFLIFGVYCIQAPLLPAARRPLAGACRSTGLTMPRSTMARSLDLTMSRFATM